MAYVLSNAFSFIKRCECATILPELKFPRSTHTPQKALGYLRKQFQEAVFMTGDYEPIFFPEENEWAALVALSGINSIGAWAKFISAVDRFNFKEIPTDILGHIFQKLIGPEERHKSGQHYTDESIVDLINAFCIRKAYANVLDPACGSGSFLVRAYYRKHHMDKHLTNFELLSGLFGCDINPFPAHLATLNLAARNISNEENYPRIIRKNFFSVVRDQSFCQIPKATRDEKGRREREEVELPPLDAIVGNPPYVRHELIPKKLGAGVIFDQAKEYIQEVVERAWPGIGLSKQSDLHLYFWPWAAQFLEENGWFGFLTSSSWLDVRYGFPLQRWILLNFRLVAILESIDEPWFEDARVKTAVTIMQRCSDAKNREENLVRFVRLKQPLADLLGEREDERQRQNTAEKLRDLILKAKADVNTSELRIMIKRQGDLWQEGLQIAQMFARQKNMEIMTLDENGLDENEDEEASDELSVSSLNNNNSIITEYGGGKWGRLLRAPDFYFEVMREFGDRFTRLGEVATIKFGIKSGCDDFFMPRNVTEEFLKQYPTEMEWQILPLMTRCKRTEVASGKVVVVKCGDGTVHPIEYEYVRPEVHNLMQVDRPIVSPEQLDRVVLWVNQPLKELKGTYVHHYITWGSKQTFASSKSKSIPIPERPTCAGRPLWYDLTGLEPGIGFWPKSQQYRHIIPGNPYRLNCNCNLYDIHDLMENPISKNLLIAILNSTLVAFFKPFYGRYAGTEGNLKTEIIDALLLEIPDPRNVTESILRRLEKAFASLGRREVTHMVEQKLMACHTADEVREAAQTPLHLPLELQQKDRRDLDDAVFELLGVTDPLRRKHLIDRLYEEVTQHFRSIRIVEVQKMEQRRSSGGRDKISAIDLAQDAWNRLDAEWQKPLSLWLSERIPHGKKIHIPEGEVRLPYENHLFESTTVFFGKKPAKSLVCSSRQEAELIASIAEAGLHGDIVIPENDTGCQKIGHLVIKRLAEGNKKIEELAHQTAAAENLRGQILQLLHSWFIQGRLK